MAGRRELLEAAAYERRRLLTALVAGRLEAEPARPGRVVVAGVALAALTVAGAALAGVLAPGTPVDWTRPGLVVSRETGAAYVVLDAGPPVLHPVANATAARLVLGSAHAPTVVPERDIAGRRIGAEVGVAGAPASLPAVHRLVDGGWTACTEDGAGVRLRIAQPPAVRAAPAAGLVVRSGGRAFLLAPAGVAGAGPAGARRYELRRVRGVRGDNRDNLLVDLGLGIRGGAPEVPRAWLDLFPAGGPLVRTKFRVPTLGSPPRYAGDPGVPPGARVGVVLTAPGGSLLLTAGGPARLDPFALTVYRETADPLGRPLGPQRLRGGPRETPVAFLPPVAQVPPPWAAARWPDRPPEPLLGLPCAELRTAPGEEPAVQLATDPAPVAAAAELPPRRRRTSVAAGRGALVRTGPGADGGRLLLVDARETAYPVVGDEARARLGYADHPAPAVPAGWAALLDRGVELAAGRHPVARAPRTRERRRPVRVGAVRGGGG